MRINIAFFSSISFVRISYKTIWLKTNLYIKTHWKIKAERAPISIFQKMRIKNLRGVSEVRFEKTRLLHLGNVENHLIRNFLLNGRLRVETQAVSDFFQPLFKYIRSPQKKLLNLWPRSSKVKSWFQTGLLTSTEAVLTVFFSTVIVTSRIS